jgi:cellulose biosynthesis protein BcsQ
MTNFKILVTSQKGGVGKSTLSANLAAYLCKHEHKTALLDYDWHGSSSQWLKGAPQIGVDIHHAPLPLDLGGNRPVHEARQRLKRLSFGSDVVVADLTWSDSITAELLFDFDLVIVPTSVSEIELNATAEFLQRFKWVFESTIHPPPQLLLCPTRVQNDQIEGNAVFSQYFPVRLMMTPPVLEGASARRLFKRGFLFDTEDACGASFHDFGQSVMSLMSKKERPPVPRGSLASARANTAPNARMQALLRLASKYESSLDASKRSLRL